MEKQSREERKITEIKDEPLQNQDFFLGSLWTGFPRDVDPLRGDSCTVLDITI